MKRVHACDFDQRIGGLNAPRTGRVMTNHLGKLVDLFCAAMRCEHDENDRGDELERAFCDFVKNNRA
jgi:hypothetical protein